jgi:hypothetical protein
LSATSADKEIIVHTLQHALAACAAAADLNIPLQLASARGAALQTGPLWFKAIIEQAIAAHPDVALTAVLDCGDQPGAVMAALRAGLTRLRFAGSETIGAKLAAMGAEFVPAAASTLDLLDARESEAACRAFLGGR